MSQLRELQAGAGADDAAFDAQYGGAGYAPPEPGPASGRGEGYDWEAAGNQLVLARFYLPDGTKAKVSCLFSSSFSGCPFTVGLEVA